MKIAYVVALVSFSLGGCVSTEMKRYVGKPIEDALISYGKPENVFEFPDGRRAYQFRWGGGTIVTPARGQAVASSFGNMTVVQTTSTPAMVLDSPCCLITYITRNNGTGYVIEDYRYPKKLVC